MRGELFLNWIASHKKNLKSPFFSQKWDEMIAIEGMQKSIASCAKAQRYYAHYESVMARDHAKLFDIILRESFEKLNYSDFYKIKGLLDMEDASFNVKKFFKTRDVLQYFIEQDIYIHTQRDSQLNAFRRWITVAEILLRRHCYEGYNLVVHCLFSMDSHQYFTSDLPGVLQEKWADLCNLISPNNDYSCFRSYMADRKLEHDLPPFFLIVRELSNINQFLGEKMHLSSSEMAIEDDCRKQCINKEIIIDDIMKSMGKVQMSLPSYLEKAYQKTKQNYKLAFESEEFTATQVGSQIKRFQHSELYSKHLLPAFWTRKCGAEKHWGKVFSIDKSF